MSEWIKRLCGVLAITVLLLTATSVAPVQASGPVDGQVVIIDGMVWEYVSAERNALDQKREQVLGALATTLHGCADDAICLYQWINYGADRWQSSIYNLASQPNDCITLSNPMAYWNNGTQVNNNSGSMVINATGFWPYNNYITAYDWINCNPSGAFNSYPAHLDTQLPNLNNNQWQGGLTMYHRITSFGIDTLGS